MAQMNYLDFDLLIEPAEKGYRARVLNSPAGQAVSEFKMPFSELEVENFLLRVGRTRRGVRRLESPEMEAAKAFGARLFDTVFEDDMRACLRSSLDEATRRGAGLRIRLRLSNTPELADLPWEYLHNSALNRFFVLSDKTPMVRYIDLPERVRPLAVKPPLRVLVMISSPSDYPPLDVEKEWAKLKNAVQDLEKQGLLVVERLETPTLATLQRELRREEYHVFHFIGHGAFDERAQDGVLLLEDEEGRGRAVSGQYLGVVLHDENTLQLAVLNACEGARTSRTDPFAGSAQSLVQQGIPAVIAMQFEITDEAAVSLAHEFYAAVADGYPVDAALAAGRKAIFAQGNDVEWGTPVLYLRAPDGRIFDIDRAQAIPLEKPAAPVAPVTPRTKDKDLEPRLQTLKEQIAARWPIVAAGGAAAVVIAAVAAFGGDLLSGTGKSPANTPVPVVAVVNTPTPTPVIEAPDTPSATLAPTPAESEPSTFTPPQSPASEGDLVEDFSEPLAADWYLASSGGETREIRDGELHLVVGTDSTFIWSNPDRYFDGDIVVDLDARQVAGPDINSYGVLIHYQDPDNYYEFSISGDGMVAANKMVDGELKPIFDSQESDSVNKGSASNHITITTQGSRLGFYVNGDLVATMTDGSHSGGDIAVVAGSFDDPGVHVAFDNVAVRTFKGETVDTVGEVPQAEPEPQSPVSQDIVSGLPGMKGLLVFTRNSGNDLNGNEIYSHDLQTGITTRLTDNSFNDWIPRWSPDGRRIAFTSNRLNDSSQNYDIWVMNADGSNPQRYIATGAWDEYAAWSPKNNGEIAFSTTADSNSEIHIGSNSADIRRITFNTASDEWPTWSPTGQQIAHSSNQSGNRDIYVIDLSSGSPQWLFGTARDENQPAWSPDGQWIVLLQRATDQDAFGQLVLISSDGSSPSTISEAFAKDPTWSPDSQWIVFARGVDSNGNGKLDNQDESDLWAIQIANGDLVPLVEAPGSDFAPSWAY